MARVEWMPSYKVAFHKYTRKHKPKIYENMSVEPVANYMVCIV